VSETRNHSERIANTYVYQSAVVARFLMDEGLAFLG